MSNTDTEPETRMIKPEVVKAGVVAYIGSVLDDAQALALTIVDDASCEKAVTLGSMVKERINWLRGKRKEIYEPLYKATESVRNEYDDPIKLGTSIEKTLSAAVIDYRLKKRREEERLRLVQEAEAKKIREDAERKEREAQAERERIIRDRERAEQKKRDDAAAEAKRVEDAAIAKKRDEDAQAKKEADERARLMREEQEARLKNATEANDVGLAARSEVILDKQTAIAPIPAPLPSSAELAEKVKRDEQAALEAEALRVQKEKERLAEEKKRDEDAARLKQLDDDAALAKAQADEADALAASSITVTRPDDRMSTSTRWKYEIKDTPSFLKLAKAVAEGRAPVEYLGFDPENPGKFRASEITKDVTRLKSEFQGEAIGIRTWPEEGGGFKVAKEAA